MLTAYGFDLFNCRFELSKKIKNTDCDKYRHNHPCVKCLFLFDSMYAEANLKKCQQYALASRGSRI